MTDITKECIWYLKSIGNIGNNIAEDIWKAGLKNYMSHEFSENDLNYIKSKHAELYDIWNSMPDFEMIVRFDRPAGCCLEYNPDTYPCNECRANKQGKCLDLVELSKKMKEILNVKSE